MTTRTFPTPNNALPFVGVAPYLALDPPGYFLRAARAYGTPLRLPLGSAGVVLVARPEHYRYLLHDAHKRWGRGSSVELVRPMLGNGLPLSDPPYWLRQRRIMQPAFNRGHLHSLVPAMLRVCERYVKRLSDGERLLAHDWNMRLTRDVIVETMFSSELGDDTPAIDHALEVVEWFLARHAMVPLPKFLRARDEPKFREATRSFDALVYRVLRTRRAEGTRHEDLLDALLHARDPETGEGMTDEQLRDELVTIFFAGHETTANMLTWTTLLLWQHPGVEARVREELRSVLRGAPPTAEDLTKLTYTHATLRESLRLYPPAWIFARQAFEDDDFFGYPVRKGQVLLLSPWVTHRTEEFWSEPERFDPERFLRDPSLGLGGGKTYAYLPFGAGPHVCIGNHFAMSEALLALATLLPRARFAVEAPEQARPRAAATLGVSNGLPVRVQLLS